MHWWLDAAYCVARVLDTMVAIVAGVLGIRVPWQAA